MEGWQITLASTMIGLAIQTGVWFWKFGKLEQKVYDQNNRIGKLETWQYEITQRKISALEKELKEGKNK